MADESENLRTPEEEFLDIPPAIEDFNTPQYSIFLDSLFSLGNISDTVVEVLEGLTVKFRLLTVAENIEVMKIVDSCPGDVSKIYVLKLETLARAVDQINGQHLRFSESMLAEWQHFRKTSEKPSDIEQQRTILRYRFKQGIVSQLFDKYQELQKKQDDLILSLKKN